MNVLDMKEKELSVDQLKELNGQVFTVKKMQSEWRKMVVITDELRVTSVNASVSILKDKVEIKGTTIYCDFYLAGKFIYNAWLSLNSLQSYIIAATQE